MKINKNTFISKIETNFENMITVSDQELIDYYEIDLTKFKDYIFKFSNDSKENIYVLVLPVSKKAAKKEIEKFFNKRLEMANKSNQERIKDKYINNYGDYLFYIVSDDNKKIYKKMEEFIKNE